MEDGLLFADLKLNEIPLKACEVAYKGKYDNTRLYVVKEPERQCFYAHAVEFHSCPATEGDASHWDNEGLEVDTLFTVTAYHDGVRHLEFNRNGDDMDGYIYYPPMADLIAMLQKVREIELEICRAADRD